MHAVDGVCELFPLRDWGRRDKARHLPKGCGAAAKGTKYCIRTRPYVRLCEVPWLRYEVCWHGMSTVLCLYLQGTLAICIKGEKSAG